jgi:hypothetical protein
MASDGTEDRTSKPRPKNIAFEDASEMSDEDGKAVEV